MIDFNTRIKNELKVINESTKTENVVAFSIVISQVIFLYVLFEQSLSELLFKDLSFFLSNFHFSVSWNAIGVFSALGEAAFLFIAFIGLFFLSLAYLHVLTLIRIKKLPLSSKVDFLPIE